MLPDLVRGDGETLVFPELADGSHGTGRILERLSKQGLGLFGIAADAIASLRLFL